MSEKNPYEAPEGFVPRPTDVYGTWDTTNTGGAARLEDVTPVFSIARDNDIEVARKALDPDDPTPRTLVTGPGLPVESPVGQPVVDGEPEQSVVAGDVNPDSGPEGPNPDGSVPQGPSGVNDGDGTDLEPGEHGDFDPGAHSIAEVKARLAEVDDAEKERILAAEREGLARKGLLNA